MRIELKGGYYITNDNYNLILRRKRITESKKDKQKKEIDEHVGYYGNLNQTIKSYLKHYVQDVTSAETIEYTMIANRVDEILNRKANEIVEHIERTM